MNPDNGFAPSQATANQLAGRLRAAQPVAAHLPRRAPHELWSGDVGASKAEEVNRIADVTR